MELWLFQVIFMSAERWSTRGNNVCFVSAGVMPPESNPRENLIVVHLRDGSTLSLCANSEDESLWVLAHHPSLFGLPVQPSVRSSFTLICFSERGNWLCSTPRETRWVLHAVCKSWSENSNHRGAKSYVFPWSRCSHMTHMMTPTRLSHLTTTTLSTLHLERDLVC